MEQTDLSTTIQSALVAAGIGGKVTVEMTSIPGVIRLLGRVVSEDERLRADQAARSVDGVLDVMDEITIGRPKIRA